MEAGKLVSQRLASASLADMSRMKHPNDDHLEAYLMNHDEVETREWLESHLIVCGGCRARVATAGALIDTIKEALRTLRARDN